MSFSAAPPTSLLGPRLASQTPEHQSALLKLFSRIGQLSSLPGVAQRVLKVANDGEADAEDLRAVIEQDPTLAIRVMSTVNSSYYGLRNEVGDLKSAIALLGFEQVRNITLTVYVARLCEEDADYECFSITGLWRHMVATAAVARLLSKVCCRADPEEAYLAGLMHDLGVLLIARYMRKSMHQVVDAVMLGDDQCQIERQLLSFDHADLGAFIARQCGLPDDICRAIEYHHHPDHCLKRDRELLHVLAGADYFANRSGYDCLGISYDVVPHDDVVRGLGLHPERMQALREELPATIEAAVSLMDI